MIDGRVERVISWVYIWDIDESIHLFIHGVFRFQAWAKNFLIE